MSAVKVMRGAVDKAKDLENLRARAALAGVELRATQDETGGLRYSGVKWAETASFTSLADVEAWLDRIDGGKRRAEGQP